MRKSIDFWCRQTVSSKTKLFDIRSRSLVCYCKMGV